MSKTTTNSGNLSGLLFVALLVLKLTHTIDWSWWWITAPLWGGLAIIAVILIIVGIAAISDFKG